VNDINPAPTVSFRDNGVIDLDSGGFHHLHLELRKADLGMLLDLVLTPDVFGVPGTPVTVFDDLMVPNMTDLYDYRVEFAARSGGLNMSVDIDNMLAQTVPEPASAALLGIGATLLAARRRRS
jgi:hypothetical protein